MQPATAIESQPNIVSMRTHELAQILLQLDSRKRIKTQKGFPFELSTIPVGAIIERGNVYILLSGTHPKCIHERMQEVERLVYLHPECPGFMRVWEYFPYYQHIGSYGIHAKHFKPKH